MFPSAPSRTPHADGRLSVSQSLSDLMPHWATTLAPRAARPDMLPQSPGEDDGFVTLRAPLSRGKGGGTMRMLFTVVADTEAATRAIENGTAQQAIKEALERLKPEAAYFCLQNGRR